MVRGHILVWNRWATTLLPASLGSEGAKRKGVLCYAPGSCRLLSCRFRAEIFLLSGLGGGGGGGGKESSSGAAGLGRWQRNLLAADELRSSSTEDKFAEVFFGRWGPLRSAMFGRCRGLFFLQAEKPMRRIFAFSVAILAADSPSGFVPGVVDGGHAWRPAMSSRRSGEDGPDCVF